MLKNSTISKIISSLRKVTFYEVGGSVVFLSIGFFFVRTKNFLPISRSSYINDLRCREIEFDKEFKSKSKSNYVST